MVDDELDQLYAARPEEFTALRKRLVTDAKRRGDTAGAQAIAAARKPTAAAWVVNALVHHDPGVRQRLGELGEQLRHAHANLDGGRIRELSAHQRALIEQLSADAFAAAGQDNPGPALRDDVVATLQAAVADPDLTARLGRLAKPERWSGFGGDVAALELAAEPDDQKVRAAKAAAEEAEARAVQELSDRRRELDAARETQRQTQLAVRKSVRQLRLAEKAAERADVAVQAAEQRVREARGALKQGS